MTMILAALLPLGTAGIARDGESDAATRLNLPIPTVFAPGIISGPQNDGAPTFSPDGRLALFERTYGNRTIIFETRREGTAWSRPRVASFSGPWNDQHPAFAPDGSYLVFVSVRSATGSPSTPAGRGVAHLWRTDRTSSGWGPPVELPRAVNISDRIFRPSVAANGDLYFMSAGSKGAGDPRWRIYRAARTADRFGPAEPLPFSDGSASDVDPFIASDGSYLVFSSQGRDAPDDGHEHLYFVRRHGAAWGQVHALRYAGDRSNADDGEAVVSPDGGTLFFSSARSGPTDRSADRAAILRDANRRELWDNGNTNVWRLSMRAVLHANGLDRDGR